MPPCGCRSCAQSYVNDIAGEDGGGGHEDDDDDDYNNKFYGDDLLVRDGSGSEADDVAGADVGALAAAAFALAEGTSAAASSSGRSGATRSAAAQAAHADRQAATNPLPTAAVSITLQHCIHLVLAVERELPVCNALTQHQACMAAHRNKQLHAALFEALEPC